MADPGIGYVFRVRIDGVDLGDFTRVEGLGARYDVTQIREGGENSHVHLLPGRIEYENLRITRPVDGSSAALVSWFVEFQEQLRSNGHLKRSTASVTAVSPSGADVASWSLVGVFPSSYSGPIMEAGHSNVLVESFELVHNGFWSGEGPGAVIGTGSSTPRRGNGLGGY